MNIKTLELAGIEPAIKAMRLPMKSGEKSDSDHVWCGGLGDCPDCPYNHDENCLAVVSDSIRIGLKDRVLSMKLCKAGSDHRKHIRLIDVWAEIQAPLYWWKEADTYRFGVDKVSESTMHTLMKKPIILDDFEPSAKLHELLTNVDGIDDSTTSLLDDLNELRESGDFETLNHLLPQSYLQTRIVKFSYEALRNIYHARKSHKLKEWHTFCDWIQTLPYSEFITGEEE